MKLLFDSPKDPYSLAVLEEFVQSHSFSTFFQSPSLQHVYAESKNHTPISFTITESKIVLACINGVILHNFSWPLNRFTARAIISGGPLITNNDVSLLDDLLKKFNNHLEKKVIYTEFRNLRKFSENEKEIFVKNGFRYKKHLDIIHDLSIPIDEQWKKVHKGRRKNIRRAERSEVVFREILTESEFDKAYELVKDTHQRVKLPMPDKSLFSEAFLQLSEPGHLKIFIVTFRDEIIASRMVFCYGELVYDWYAGASEEHFSKYPNDFLIWRIIDWASKNGYKNFAFGGAGIPNVPYGVRDYKLKFGGELVEHGRFEKIHKPALHTIGRIGFKIYKNRN